MATTVRLAAASANITDQTPATAPTVAAPHLLLQEREIESRQTISDIRKLTTMTTTSGNTARYEGWMALSRAPRGGPRRVEITCRCSLPSRTSLDGRHGFDRIAIAFARPRAAASPRQSHHRPKARMMIEAMIPMPGAANVVVEKYGIGIALLTDGVPGSADMVKVKAPRPIVAGISRRGMSAAGTSSAPSGPARRRRRRR